MMSRAMTARMAHHQVRIKSLVAMRARVTAGSCPPSRSRKAVVKAGTATTMMMMNTMMATTMTMAG